MHETLCLEDVVSTIAYRILRFDVRIIVLNFLYGSIHTSMPPAKRFYAVNILTVDCKMTDP